MMDTDDNHGSVQRDHLHWMAKIESDRLTDLGAIEYGLRTRIPLERKLIKALRGRFKVLTIYGEDSWA